MKVPVVIVDYDEADHYITKRILSRTDFAAKIVEYETGDSFLQIFNDDSKRRAEVETTPPPILVLLDINMPGLSGFEVLEEIKKDIESKGMDPDYMVILMFSSSNHAQDKADAFAYDFVRDYVVKPITPEKIQAIYDKFYADL